MTTAGAPRRPVCRASRGGPFQADSWLQFPEITILRTGHSKGKTDVVSKSRTFFSKSELTGSRRYRSVGCVEKERDPGSSLRWGRILPIQERVWKPRRQPVKLTRASPQVFFSTRIGCVLVENGPSGVRRGRKTDAPAQIPGRCGGGTGTSVSGFRGVVTRRSSSTCARICRSESLPRSSSVTRLSA